MAGGILGAGFSPSAVADPLDGEEFRLDGSYVAATAGNWVLGVGAIDRWWGPGWQ
ncbi:MAG TPA: capsule assembly Wzi family protein, partial [Marinobacter adhaerens]|nr:capsule assembly Wzi family protein [Marinobacter adhaerens]